MAVSVLKDPNRANNLGTFVSLSQGVQFTCPSDGYIICSTAPSNNASAAAEIRGSEGTDFFRLGGYSNGTYATWVANVRKGMRVTPYTITNGGQVVFRPLA